MEYTFNELLTIYTKCDEETTNCFECPMYPLINGLDICEALTSLGRIYDEATRNKEEE